MAISSTRLRYISSGDLDELMAFVSLLPFKIEIKGAPSLVNKKWFLFFVIPEIDGFEWNSVNL